jgi:hypothetical protein
VALGIRELEFQTVADGLGSGTEEGQSSDGRHEVNAAMGEAGHPTVLYWVAAGKDGGAQGAAWLRACHRRD